MDVMGDDICTQAANFSAIIVSANLVASLTSGNVVRAIIIERLSIIKSTKFKGFLEPLKRT